jgi:hypothetical protein
MVRQQSSLILFKKPKDLSSLRLQIKILIEETNTERQHSKTDRKRSYELTEASRQ